MIKISAYLYKKFITASRIKTLSIEAAGMDNDDFPFVKLSGGMYFYGPKPSTKERKFYRLFLSQKTKKMLPFESFQIAMDIVVRYTEGNLKWGGPAKEAHYKVKKGDTIAEMGAFRGYYTLYLSQKVGPKGKIIAIEPIPENVMYLKKNIEANKIDNVEIIAKGVWNTNEAMVFNRKPTDFQSGSIDINYSGQTEKQIEVNTLDTILSECKIDQVDFMLIQLNGAEFEALKGLKKVKPKNLSIAARYDKDDRNIAGEIVDLLIQRGYKTSILQKKFIYAQCQ